MLAVSELEDWVVSCGGVGFKVAGLLRWKS